MELVSPAGPKNRIPYPKRQPPPKGAGAKPGVPDSEDRPAAEVRSNEVPLCSSTINPYIFVDRLIGADARKH